MLRFVFQTVSVGGVHANAMIMGTFHPLAVGDPRALTPFVTAQLARKYKTDGMNAYVDLIQNKERELGVDIITHQKWSASLVSFTNLPLVAHETNTGAEPTTSMEF